MRIRLRRTARLCQFGRRQTAAVRPAPDAAGTRRSPRHPAQARLAQERAAADTRGRVSANGQAGAAQDAGGRRAGTAVLKAAPEGYRAEPALD